MLEKRLFIHPPPLSDEGRLLLEIEETALPGGTVVTASAAFQRDTCSYPWTPLIFSAA
jgi:hypothetical protein